MKILQTNIVTLSLLFVFPILIGGCLDFTRETPVKDTPESLEEIIVISDIDGVDVADLVPIPLEKADNLVREFAIALNEEDIAKVLSCMTFSDDDYYTMEWAKVAVDNYKVFFNGEQIVKAELMGSAEYHQGLVYRLYSAGDNYKEIYLNARYIDGEHIYDDLVIYDNILFYSFRAERYLEELIKGIGQNDPETIISLLTYDDYANPYPQFKAENIIKNYEASFDTETLDFGFVGTETKKAAAGNLIYVIRGSKNSVPREHEIMVAYGDGLVGIIDDWIPTK